MGLTSRFNADTRLRSEFSFVLCISLRETEYEPGDVLIEEGSQTGLLLTGALIALLGAYGASYWQAGQNRNRSLMELKLNVLRDYSKATQATMTEQITSIGNLKIIQGRMVTAEKTKKADLIRAVNNEFINEMTRFVTNANVRSADLHGQTSVARVLFGDKFEDIDVYTDWFSLSLSGAKMDEVIGGLEKILKLQQTKYNAYGRIMSEAIVRDYL